jgi:kumamolisin
MLPGARALGVAGPEEWIEVTIKLRRKQALPEINGRPARRMTREEFESSFGAAQADIDKVVSVLTGLGLKIIQQDAANSSLRAGGTAESIEQAFQVKLFHYSHPDGNYRGRTGSLQVPAELDGIIVGVFGLDNRRMVKRRHSRRKPASLSLATTDAASRAWFYPAELASVYAFPAGNGQGQTIGILEFGGGFFPDDLAAFCKSAQVPVPGVKAISVNNTPTNQKDGAEGEVMLDVEIVAGVCPAASIVVYFSSFDENGWITAIDTAVQDKQNPLTVLSCSWGYAEDAQGAWSAGALDAINDTLKSAALLGVSICVAAGDDGSDDQVGDGHAHVDFPSSSPYVLAVGGTTLKRGAAGGQPTETAWKDGDGLRKDNGGSTGGGVSVHFARPSWQNVQIASVNPGSIDGRVVPDVAADASANTGYWVVVDGQGGASGGTSAATPLWASLIALINASLGGGKQVGYLTPVLYQVAGSGSGAGAGSGSGAAAGAGTGSVGQQCCRDITSGDNKTAAVGGYSAGPGFDAVTGWGVPMGGALLDALKTIV